MSIFCILSFPSRHLAMHSFHSKSHVHPPPLRLCQSSQSSLLKAMKALHRQMVWSCVIGSRDMWLRTVNKGSGPTDSAGSHTGKTLKRVKRKCRMMGRLLQENFHLEDGYGTVVPTLAESGFIHMRTSYIRMNSTCSKVVR